MAIPARPSLTHVLTLAAAAVVLLPAFAWPANYVVTLSGSGDAAAIEPREVEIQADDSVTWKAVSGRHHIQAYDGSFRCAYGCDHLGGDGSALLAPWTVTLTFNEPGEIPYQCPYHSRRGGPTTGTIIVKGEAADQPAGPMAINFGHGGSWYDPGQDGQGFSLEVVPDAGSTKAGTGTLVAYRQRWFQGVGPINDTEALLDVYRVTGGAFDDTAPVASEIIGTAVASFSNCTEGSLAYSLDLDRDGNPESANKIALTRLTPDVLCEESAVS